MDLNYLLLAGTSLTVLSRDLKQTDAAAANLQIFIQDLPVDRRQVPYSVTTK